MARSLVSLVEAHRLLAADGVSLSYVTLKRRSQAGVFDAARVGRKFDLDRLRQALVSETIGRGSEAPSDVDAQQPSATHAMETPVDLSKVLVELHAVRALLETIEPALRRLTGAVDALDGARRFLMLRDDEARGALRDRLEAANAQVEALRRNQADALDLARLQATLDRLAGMLERNASSSG